MAAKTEGRRVARVEREVHEALAHLLITEFKRDLPGITSVSRVSMPADLRSARVYISVIGAADLKDKTALLLQDLAPRIQGALARRLSLRYTPRLSFYPDTTTDKILRVENLFRQLEKMKEPSEE
ncbi:MAG: 30S ribosome-binding factor RbfA [Bdellovibrionaceae bacterium]|nr:30S ribosome-binding factor RbfA [Pseudobdellovibrionaceae bacterium]